MRSPSASERACARNGQTFLAGAGIAERYVAELGGRRVALVTGSRWLEQSGWFARLVAARGRSFEAHVRVRPNPKLVDVLWLLEEVRRAQVEQVLAVGGGSAIDAAKVIALAAPSLWSGDDAALPTGAAGIRLAVLPTTAGTGSEVTPYASLESRDGRKFSFSDARLYPATVVHDPTLLVGQPPEVAGDCAADALSHCVESLWSKKATAESRAMAAEGLSLVVRQAVRAQRGNDLAAKAALQQAALLAGAAISVSQTTAVHAVSYPMTARYGVPHGRALALLLPHFMRFNEAHLTPEAREAICASCGVKGWEEATRTVAGVLGELGLPRRLSEAGLDAAALEVIVAQGYRPDRMGNNPVVPTPEELGELLQRAF